MNHNYTNRNRKFDKYFITKTYFFLLFITIVGCECFQNNRYRHNEYLKKKKHF